MYIQINREKEMNDFLLVSKLRALYLQATLSVYSSFKISNDP